jgi:HEAT repeat protein
MSKGLGVFAVVALLGIAADLAFAHGGTYSGPNGGGTPSFGGPHGGNSGGGQGGNTGGGGQGGGTTPGAGAGGGGSTPPGGGAPPRPGSGAGRGGQARGGGTTPGGKPKGDSDRTHDWDWWWELNDDQYLKIKAAVRSKANLSSDSDVIMGKGDGASVSKLTVNQIRTSVLPVVRLGMTDTHFDTRAGAVIATGKIADMTLPNVDEIVAEMKKLLADTDKVVRESACLGLGLLGDKRQVPDLIAIMKNDSKARAETGQGTKDILARQRAFAAVAVGLIGLQDPLEPGFISELVEAMKKEGAHQDLQVFPALALSILKSDKAVGELKNLVKDADADQYVRAHAIVALGKLGEKSAVPWLVKDGLTDKNSHVQRSSAVALGLLTDKEDEKTVEMLITHAKSAADRAVRNFCLIALGQIGSPKGRDFLVQQVSKGQPHDRTFSALALGVYGNKWKDSRTELGKVLLDAWNEIKNDSERGAFAIGMGLLDYKAGAQPLMDELKTGGSPDLKGHVATALGLLGEKAAIPMVQELAKKVSDLDSQRRASIALGLIGDPNAVEILTKVIADASSNLSALGGAAVALGFIGDKSAVATLTDMLSKRDAYKDNARAFAAVALGILGDKSELPLLSKIQENCNYLATTDGLTEILLIY